MKVSLYKRLTDKEGTVTEIVSILNDIKLGKYKEEISKVRLAKTKQEKTTFKTLLPAFTASGIFNGSRTENSLINHSGLLQIDVDNDLTAISNKNKIYSDKFIYCGFISPSGNGLKLIVKISPVKEKHKMYFNALCKYLDNTYNFQTDKSVKDISRLLFVSYDPELYINENSEIFTEYETPEENKVIKASVKHEHTPVNRATPPDKDKTADVEKVLIEIENKQLDITQGYDNWLKIGFALSEYFGESGREYFHRISRFYPDYDKDATNAQFDECLKQRRKGVNIESLFYYAKQYGVDISYAAKALSKPPKIKEQKEISNYEKVEKYLSEIYLFRYNVVSNIIEFKKEQDPEYTIANEDNIYRLLQHNKVPFSLANIRSLLRSDFVPLYNPFLEYYESMPLWTSQDPDYITELANYIVAVDQSQFNIHFKKMLVRTVVCSLDEDYFNKHVFVLVHAKQNSGKSTFCRYLCPPGLKKYYTEVMNADKDGLIALCENLIISLDELSTMNKVEINALKSIISKQNVKVRRPFDTRPSLMPRRASFIGNTNKDEFLNDETGSVRWLCFEITEINWDYKNKIDINLVWAQAYELYKSGFKYDLTIDEISRNEEVNKRFNIENDETGFILKHFTTSDKETGNFYTTTDVVDFLNTRYNYLKTNVRKTGIAMKSLGFERHQEYRGTHQVKGYYLREIHT